MSTLARVGKKKQICDIFDDSNLELAPVQRLVFAMIDSVIKDISRPFYKEKLTKDDCEGFITAIDWLTCEEIREFSIPYFARLFDSDPDDIREAILGLIAKAARLEQERDLS
uniref:Uncharacterized protein n=1 Tax=Dictyoglomus turgidum TaxID=513050 RepID=A0A7C3SQS6_9BACT